MTRMHTNTVRATLSGLRTSFGCGFLLALTTLCLAQNALDANLRVGSGGYNARRPAQVTMARSPYTLSNNGNIVYNRSVAFNDTVYNRPFNANQFNRNTIDRRTDRVTRTDPRGIGRTAATASSLARSPYSADPRATATMNAPRIPASRAGETRASIQRTVYRPGTTVSSLTYPTATISKQPYRPGRGAAGR